MKDISNTNERIKFVLEQMEKAMPAVKKQVAVYEKKLGFGKKPKKTSDSSSIQKCLNPLYWL